MIFKGPLNQQKRREGKAMKGQKGEDKNQSLCSHARSLQINGNK
jgi:hypothetical protein